MFDLRQLRYFVAVAETLNFTEAAQRLHISQPPLSQQIRALEEDMQTRLFERNKRHVALTEPGRLFLQEARGILARANAARDVISEAADGRKGRLRLAYPASLVFHSALPHALLRFSDIAPDVTLDLHEMYSQAQYEALTTGQIDAGLVRAQPKSANIAEQLDSEVIDHEQVLLAMPANHPMANRDRVAMADVAGEAFVTQTRSYSTTFRDALLRMAATNGFHPNIRQEAQQITGVLALVSAGVGMALVPSSLRVVQLPEVRMLELTDTEAEIMLAVTWRKAEPSPVLARFLEAVRAGKETAA